MEAKKPKILQVSLDQLSEGQLKAKIDTYLAGMAPKLIVTANPEILLVARVKHAFLNILNGADLVLADGFGLAIAALVKHGLILTRHTGADLSIYLLGLAEREARRVAIINWSGGLSDNSAIEKTLTKLYPKLDFKVWATERDGEDLEVAEVAEFAPEIVLCALGAPFQETLLTRLKFELGAKVLVGVGGSFDYLTGKAPRAPKLMRSLGLEWVWRLLLNPRARAKRIWQAMPVFPFYFILDDLIHPWLYRPNVVGFVYQDDEVLIVNSAKQPRDIWKLPQGGRDAGESLEMAIRREMSEELALKSEEYELKVIYKNIFKYRWRGGYSLNGYKGQRQSLCLLAYHGDKKAIKLDAENRDYKWVKIENLLQEVDPVNERAYTLFISKYREMIGK